jgi:hypothetical protein
MEEFTQLFGNLLAFVYHCFDRMVIHGYLSGLSRPEQVVYFVRQVLGLPVVSKEVLSQRTRDYQDWVEAYARNHHIPIEWAEKGVRKEDYVSPRLHRLVKKNAYGVYFIFKSMEQGRTFRITVPKYPTQDPDYRILAHQRSRFTHYPGIKIHDTRIIRLLEVLLHASPTLGGWTAKQIHQAVLTTFSFPPKPMASTSSATISAN